MSASNVSVSILATEEEASNIREGDIVVCTPDGRIVIQDRELLKDFAGKMDISIDDIVAAHLSVGNFMPPEDIAAFNVMFQRPGLSRFVAAAGGFRDPSYLKLCGVAKYKSYFVVTMRGIPIACRVKDGHVYPRKVLFLTGEEDPYFTDVVPPHLVGLLD